MVDLSTTVAAKSDQLTADDLIGGPRILTITGVKRGGDDQPIDISYEGDGGKPYRPNKTMRRVLIEIWGKDGTGYVGRSLKVFRNPKVKWSSDEVGGIQISELEGVTKTTVLMLQQSKGAKKPYTVKPLVALQAKADKNAEAAASWVGKIAACQTDAEVDAIAGNDKLTEWRAKLRDRAGFNRPELADQIDAAFKAKVTALAELEAAKKDQDEPPPQDAGGGPVEGLPL